MATVFRYRALDPAGRVVKGQIKALHELDLESQIERMDLTLLRAWPSAQKEHRIRKLSRRELINFFFYLEMLARAGVPIIDALRDLRDSSDSVDVRRLAGSVAERVETGGTLSDSLADHPGVFPDIAINLVRAAELTGTLPEVLLELTNSLKWQDELAAQTKKLLMYPAFVLTVLTGVIFFMMTYLVPQLVAFIKQMGQTLPLHTRLLVWVSEVFVEYWWIILSTPPLVVFAIVAVARSNRAFRHWLHGLELKIPWIGAVIKKLILARVADTLGLMYRTGIPIIEGMAHCEKVSSNMIVREAVARAHVRIANGLPLSQAFAAEQLFPSLVVRMLRVGENTGELDGALKNVSYFYTRDIDESIGKVQAMIEPALTVTLGLILGWVMLSVLGPIYDTISKIRM